MIVIASSCGPIVAAQRDSEEQQREGNRNSVMREMIVSGQPRK